MVLAYHNIITVYGFWLPNDPRGSWSEFVRSWELFLAAGRATKTESRRSVARIAHDATKRRDAKKSLRYPPVELDGVQARAIARGFAQAVADAGYRILACAVMPDHVHLVIERDGRSAEQIISHLKRAASRRLREENIHPLREFAQKGTSLPSPWARGRWIVFLDSEEDVRRAINYTNDNPTRDGLKEQDWNFVTERGGNDETRTRRRGAAR